MNSFTRCVSIKVFGLVQGVCFRAYTKKKAQNLRLTGFVRNKQDGTVYIESMGSIENIEHFICWCRKGSPNAKVNNIDVTEISEKRFDGFEIRY